MSISLINYGCLENIGSIWNVVLSLIITGSIVHLRPEQLEHLSGRSGRDSSIIRHKQSWRAVNVQCRRVPGSVLYLGLFFSSAAFCCCFPSVLGFVFGLLALCFPVLSPCFRLCWTFFFSPPYFFSLK